MGLDPNSRARFNLDGASILLLDATPLGLGILTQVLAGFGAKALHPCMDMDAAERVIRRETLDLAIVDAMPPSGDGYDFVRWLRRHGGEPNRYTPVVMTTAHTPRSHISRARDCGAHITIKKPFPPITLLERIVWAASEGRSFVSAENYVGPDRRFQDLGPPEGERARRRDDIELDPKLGDIDASQVREARG
jgi:DNA-binding response OmpR family regulator